MNAGMRYLPILNSICVMWMTCFSLCQSHVQNVNIPVPISCSFRPVLQMSQWPPSTSAAMLSADIAGETKGRTHPAVALNFVCWRSLLCDRKLTLQWWRTRVKQVICRSADKNLNAQGPRVLGKYTWGYSLGFRFYSFILCVYIVGTWYFLTTIRTRNLVYSQG